ncbi:MAG: sensor histidine kinase [Alcaligenes faecalis]|jgi:signal transduction histidine kinase|uniref:histidine kinase n=1 Tax=Alcaligenes aquatilis TaxID=323284 RepID=A0ABY4NLF5_9BURK|nr:MULTISPECIES: sensor histidine kinase [Alcaligenes]AWG35529.1 histidine kinase [Alcaligenes aquatilis]MCC9163937.1 sensor histidine kinase [Alcaligenes sp. MMA]MCH4226066.1 sensor histidine kinase [Alcaligenes faecalis]UQN36841.1 sensor histidine kinase [Alcaligenes aquatilis]HBQ89406.1 histidine kinase [Alcaligenes faecalis]
MIAWRGHSILGSLRGRLLLGTLAWILISIVLAGLGLNRLFQDHVYRQFEQRLQTHLDQIMADVNLDNADGVTLQSRLSDPLFEQPYSGMYWQIARQEVGSDQWSVVLRSTSLWDEALDVNAPDTPSGVLSLTGPEKQRLVVLRQELDEVNDKGQSLQIMVAGKRELLAEPLARFERILFLSLGGLAVGLILAAILQVVLALYPLHLLRRRLLDVQEGREPQVGGSFPSEIQPLVDDFNAVLSANAGMVDRARAQAGNLAHAVKTPLTIMGNAAQAEDPHLAAVVSEQVALAQRQVDHHLSRARAMAVRAIGVRTDVSACLQSLCRVMGRLHKDKQIHLDVSEQELVFKGEEQDLQEMAGNLLDNACKWATQNVWCQVWQQDNVLHLVVEDDGPGLDPEQLERVFGRGQRADERHPGFGLGLDIVRELARSYQGKVQASVSEKGGLRLDLTLAS